MDRPQKKQVKEAAGQRSKLYGLLADIYGHEPNAELIRWIRSPALLDPLFNSGIQFDSDFLDTPEVELLRNLAQEYVRLFLGPGMHVSPHESTPAS